MMESVFFLLKKSLLLCYVIMHILFTILGREFYLIVASFYILFCYANLALLCTQHSCYILVYNA